MLEATPNKHKDKPKALDGFMSIRRSPTAKKQSAKPQSNSGSSTGRTSTTSRPKPQKASTLMRTAVKKPASAPKATSVAAGTASIVANITKPEEKLASRIEPVRAARASHVGKSNLISRFGTGTIDVATSVIKRTVPLSVKPMPSHATGAVAPSPKPNAEPAKKADPLHKGLVNARSHEQPAIKKKRIHHRIGRKLGLSPRATGISAAILAVIVLGGFFAYQNTPNLAMRVASARAGVSASVPSYKPAGFAIKGPIKYSPGVITISFRSNSDSRSFQLTQHASNWNSEALLSNVVTASNKPYQTFEDKGRTIYIYDNSNATWVNGGVWYKIEGNSQLTSDQLIRIASSM